MSHPVRTVRRRRLALRVRGVVQGVGFRPFVCRLGRRLALAGTVRNTAGARGVEVVGPASEPANVARGEGRVQARPTAHGT